MTWADTSTYAIIDGFGREVDRITEQTGLPTIANFAAPKIFTLQRRFQDASTYVATLDAFLLHRLTNGLRYTTEDTMGLVRCCTVFVSDPGVMIYVEDFGLIRRDCQKYVHLCFVTEYTRVFP